MRLVKRRNEMDDEKARQAFLVGIVEMVKIMESVALCKRVVTGKRWVKTVHVEGHYEDIVEWHRDDIPLAVDREPIEDIEEVTRADDIPF